jgi:hypothetical protein
MLQLRKRAHARHSPPVPAVPFAEGPITSQTLPRPDRLYTIHEPRAWWDNPPRHTWSLFLLTRPSFRGCVHSFLPRPPASLTSMDRCTYVITHLDGRRCLRCTGSVRYVPPSQSPIPQAFINSRNPDSAAHRCRRRRFQGWLVDYGAPGPTVCCPRAGTPFHRTSAFLWSSTPCASTARLVHQHGTAPGGDEGQSLTSRSAGIARTQSSEHARWRAQTVVWCTMADEDSTDTSLSSVECPPYGHRSRLSPHTTSSTPHPPALDLALQRRLTTISAPIAPPSPHSDVSLRTSANS